MTRHNMSDLQRDSRSLTWSVGAILFVYSVVVAIHNGIYHEILSTPGPNPTFPRVLSNIAAMVVLLILVKILKVSDQRSWWRVMLGLVLAAVFSAVTRTQIAVLFPPFKDQELGPAAADLTLGILVLLGGGILGFTYTVDRRRFREEAQRASDERVQRELALTSLGNEEVRVQRSVAEGLHGGLQQRLVLQVIRLDRAIAQAQERGASQDELASLAELREDLDVIREQDVRQMSRLLYPDGIEVGVVPAVRMLLRRLPAGISTRLQVSEDFRNLDDPTAAHIAQSERLLLVRIIEEAITNALRHGHAASIEVWLATEGDAALAEVLNDGTTIIDAVPPSVGGMSRLATRVELAGGSLAVGNQEDCCAGASLERESEADMVVAVCVRLPLIGASGGD